MKLDLGEGWLKFVCTVEYICHKIEPAIARMMEVAKVVGEKSKPLIVVSKLAEAQFIYWEYLNNEFIEEILEFDDTDEALLNLHANEPGMASSTIAACLGNPALASYGEVLTQTISAYENGHYDLAAMGIISIFDGLLFDFSGMPTITQISKRAEAFLDKFSETGFLENEEYAILALHLTYNETVKSLAARAPFNEKEPEKLNRHWIMHGRSRRKRTELDCMKLFRLLYGTLLFKELGDREFLNQSCS